MTIIDDVREHFHVSDFYKVLKVSKNSDYQEIKKAYLLRSLELHPDRKTDANKKEEFKRKFQIVSEVYKILSNEETRIDYDRTFQPRSESTIYEEVPLEKCNQHDEYYSYNCRCSGLFILSKAHLAPPNSINVFIVECDSCSNSIKIALQ